MKVVKTEETESLKIEVSKDGVYMVIPGREEGIYLNEEQSLELAHKIIETVGKPGKVGKVIGEGMGSIG